MRKNSHAAIEMFVGWLPERVGRWVLVGGMVVSGAFFAILSIKGFDLALRVYPHNSPAMRISMSYAYSAIPVGAVFMLIYTLELIAEQFFLIGRASGRERVCQ